ncbi:hypothetical protein FQN57_003703 [Myotisia sp. PD_48]|nr:hypothetical protein FQN57_003703 [Myotisia sp. PD_48]
MAFIKSIKGRVQRSKSSSASSPPSATHSLVLSDEYEAFLNRVAKSLSFTASPKTDGIQPPITEEAQNTKLPDEPSDDELRQLAMGEAKDAKVPETKPDKAEKAKKAPWGWMKLGSAKRKQGTQKNETSKEQAVKTEKEQEEADLTAVLERLNLAAVNNQVFSISTETQELLEKFKLVFKDLVNGVPTAYDDLESLLTNGDQQLQKTYNKLPGFLQKLVQQLPDKVSDKFAPEILAAATKAGESGFNKENATKAASAAKKMGLKFPSLKDLTGKPAAIAGLLRSIITFLRARFPIIFGMNVLWSLALFLLLLVLWYCHKRGRESRLEREASATMEQTGGDVETEETTGEGTGTPADRAYDGASSDSKLITTDAQVAAPIGLPTEDINHEPMQALSPDKALKDAGASLPPEGHEEHPKKTN